MPELPEVEIQKEYLDANALNSRITKTEVRSPEMLAGVSVRQLQRALKGRVFERSRRHGKYLFARVSGGPWLVMHFGMTGSLQFFREKDQEPKFSRILIYFEKGRRLAYISRRKLGRVQLVDSVGEFIEEQQLGPDALDPTYSFKQFNQSYAGSSSMIKSALMNQKALAGVGNEYSDEILYQAGVHPQKKCREMSEEDLKLVYRQMRKVLRTAVERKADPSRYPRSFLLPHRHGDGKCPGGKGDLKSIKVGGRTSFFCPSRQRK